MQRRSLLLSAPALVLGRAAEAMPLDFVATVLSPGGEAGTPILRPSYMRPGTSFTRASTATYLDSTGALQMAVANAPRFQGTAQRLLIEGARTNMIRNPRAEGAVVGTPGTAPTNWAGIQQQIIGTGVEGGIPYVDMRWSGSVATTVVLTFDSVANGPVVPAQVWTNSMFVSLVGGSLANVSLSTPIRWYSDSTGTFISQTLVPIVPIAAALSSQRYVFTDTAPSTPGVASYAQGALRGATTGAYDLTLRIGVPQFELAPFASSPILPPVGTPGVATRAADVANWVSPAALPPIWTLYGGFMMPSMAAPNETTFPRILSASNGTTSNNVEMFSTPPAIQMTATGAGTAFPNTVSFALGAGVFTKFAATFSQTLRTVRFSVAGASPISSTGTIPPTGLNIISIGNRIDNARQNYGEFGPFTLLPGVFASDAQLRGLST